MLLSCVINVSAQEVLKPKIAEKLSLNVFEIVYLKIEEDPLSYEKELPLDRIPYAERMDKYDSIGTAFLLKDHKFYTAAHVLNLQNKTQADKFYIRTQNKNIYKIKNIEKFATDRDFVIFDVEDFNEPKAKGLDFDENYVTNSSVFAVGNAQGEGIVMRNGLLTSTTPESRHGNWLWLRFSAAASPGNSGGPLVTPQGKVIGIVAMKNSSENLNYALPIKETKNVSDCKGEIHSELYYNLPNISTQKFYHSFDFEIDLPKSIEEVRNICYNAFHDYTEKFVEKTSAEYKYSGEKSFTHTDKGNIIYTNSYNMSFPYTICLNEKNKWGCYSPSETSELKLDKNSKITAGGMLGLVMTKLKKPDDISVEEYIKNPKLLIDTLAKVFVLSRPVGSEKINITSFGQPSYTSTHTDTFGRTWLISAFTIPFADYALYNFSLPLPDGIYSMTGIAPTHHIFCGFNFDMEFLSDFVLTGYSSTYREMQEYLNIPEEVYPRHKVLENASLLQTENETILKTDFFSLTFPKEVINIDEKSEINLGISVRPDNQKGLTSVISLCSVEAQKNTNDNTLILYSKQFKPHEDSAEETFDGYNKICSKTIPYDGNPFENEQKTSVFVTDVKEDSVSVLGLIYKGSRMDVIKENVQKVSEKIQEN